MILLRVPPEGNLSVTLPENPGQMGLSGVFVSNRYLSESDIRVLQVEPTSRCNLACPQCARMDLGKLNSRLPIKDLPEKDIAKVFPESLIPQLEQVLFNGNYGDPVIYPHLMQMVDRLLEFGRPRIFIYTNGSLRNPEWWSELGRKLSEGRHLVIFSVDGLSDTNAYYRVNSNFEKIMANAQAYIDAGGRARWDYLMFAHNIHQVDEAMELAKNMGFKLFNKKKTARFIYDNHIAENKNNSSTPIFNKKSEVKAQLEPANYEALSKFDYIKEKYGSWQNYVNETEINCKYRNEMAGLYVDFNADVWPCCWLGAPKYFVYPTNTQRQQLDKILAQYPEDFNNLRSHNWADILNHPWFNELLVKSWSNKIEDDNAKLITCGRTCGSDYEFSSGGNWKNSEVIPLDG